MTDGRALLAAICAEPEEDTPRLSYADWLEEHGDDDARARAAFIRTQIERYRLPPEDDDADMAERRLALEDREAALRRSPKHAGARPWAHSQHPLPPGTPDGVRYLYGHPDWFVRGFRGFAKSTPERFAEVGPGFFDVYPVHGLYDDRDALPLTAAAARFLACPWLTRVRRLEMNFDGPLAERVFGCEHLAGLEHLVIRRGVLERAGALHAKPRALVALQSLTLTAANVLTAAGAVRTAELLAADGLTSLTLSGSGDNEDGALRELAAHDRFQSLTRLQIDCRSGAGYSGPAGFRALAASRFWPRLRSLHLFPTPNSVGLAALVAVPPPPALRRLQMYRSLSAEPFVALAASPLLRQVSEFGARWSAMGDSGAVALAKSSHIVNLASLDLEDCHIGPKGVKAIAEAPWSAGLVKLNLQRNPIKKAGVEALVAPGRFPRLRRLEVFGSIRTGDLKDKLYARFGDAVRFNVV